ncbi:response regulator [Ornithinibacillus halophilus]|uniref:Two-component system, response regulator, stage 0 sporulation protein F n=1 Tax=Ornithinibacillus halophilus TaxID=930117 RepID=A0A1M5LDL3_9BACI|nr:response regulator [Ornithinibacillus halophilus]SHG62799.1 two-component system, response regulator, stage 0 sporulation protein F [Ornithinibacillus halophilus]
MVILVVDDEIGIRLLLEDILSHEGFTVITAENGKEALKQIEIHSIDLMMLDYKLPIIDGIEVVQHLHKNNCGIPVILMSGLIETASEKTENFPQVKSLLEKPFDIQKVVQLVKDILAKSS